MQTSIPASPTLVLDASQPEVFVGLYHDDQGWLSVQESSAPALSAVFQGVEKVLDTAGITLAQVRAFVHCHGPGSTLGIRITSMALLSWQACLPKFELYEYNALALVRAAIHANRPEGLSSTPFAVVSEWRKDAWNLLPGEGGQVIGCTHEHLPGDVEFYYLPQRKKWGQPPSAFHAIAYPFARLPHLLKHGLLHLDQAQKPSVFTHTEAHYQKWIPSRHR